MIKTEWVITLCHDIWGNEEDGYTVNDQMVIDNARLIILKPEKHNVNTPNEFKSAYPSDKQIKEIFSLNNDAKLDLMGDDINIYVNLESGYPIGEMNCISHKSLSPVIKHKDYKFYNQ
jgi:hypothetical protein